MLCNAGRLNPYALLNFAVSNSWSRLSKVFERSVSKVLKLCFYQQSSSNFITKNNISVILEIKTTDVKSLKRQCYVLYSFRYPHCWSDKNVSKKTNICSKSIVSNILDNVGRIPTCSFPYCLFSLFYLEV